MQRKKKVIKMMTKKYYFDSIIFKNLDNETFISFYSHLFKLVLGSAFYDEEINFTLASLNSKSNIKKIFSKNIFYFNELKNDKIRIKSDNIKLLKETINFNKFFRNSITNKRLAKKTFSRLTKDVRKYYRNKDCVEYDFSSNIIISAKVFRALLISLFIDYPKSKISVFNVNKYILPYLQDDTKVLFNKYYKHNNGFYEKIHIKKNAVYFTEIIKLNKQIISLLKK